MSPPEQAAAPPLPELPSAYGMERPEPSTAAPSPRLIGALAATCAVSAANIYICQPILPEIARSFGVTDQAAASVATSAQIGYAVGILAFVPLGDAHRRRPLILSLGAVSAIALIAAALSPSLPLLIFASFAIGAFTPIPQLVIPLAVALSSPASRGRIIGLVQGGLLVGVLASRTYAGGLADLLDWRAVYCGSFLLMILVGLMFWREVPPMEASIRLTYRQLQRSLVDLFTSSQMVQRICVSGAFVGIAFGAFWTTLAFMLQAQYGYGSAIAGLFGLAAAASALCSPRIGRFADRQSPRAAFTLPLLLCSIGLLSLLGAETSIWLLLAGTILLDVGVWGNQVVNQVLLFESRAELHSRLNTLYFGFRFLGIGLGSLLGSICWQFGGWSAVAGLGLLAVAGAFATGAPAAMSRSRPSVAQAG